MQDELYARGVATEDGERFQTLEEHLLNTAELAFSYGAELGFGELSRLAALLHDAGKAGSAWQAYLLENMRGKPRKKINHASSGAILLEKFAEIPGDAHGIAKDAVRAAVLCHHNGGLPDFINLNGRPDFWERLEKNRDEKKTSEIQSKLPEPVKEKIYACLQSADM